MEYGAIDLHLRRCQIRIVTAEGQVVCDRQVPTTAEALTAFFGPRAPMPVLLEAGTESEWVAQVVEACGHEAIVADPNYTLMYGARQRIKTDRRDAAALAEACRRGIYRRAHRVSAEQRRTRRDLRIREQLVRVRTQTINLLRAQLRQEGYRLGRGGSEGVVTRYRRLTLSEPLRTAVAPLIELLTHLHEALKTADTQVKTRAAADPIARRLMTAPGIGPVTALTFRATVDSVTRFDSAGNASAFVGLVPSEDSSAERRRRGPITKRGPTALRSLLIQAAWSTWRQRSASGALYAWVERLAARRGKQVAVVALARRLTRILYAMWRDETDYRPGGVAAPA